MCGPAVIWRLVGPESLMLTGGTSGPGTLSPSHLEPRKVLVGAGCLACTASFLAKPVVRVGRWKRTELPGVSLSPGLRSAVRGRVFAQRGLSLEEKLEAKQTLPYVQQSRKKSRSPRQ